ncbi:aldo/keto reductase [Pseudoalteromonas luteoviolacea]|uniref:aldo/keto reductase n=1 Tax=Pseudoalteromonas luteoviolacea TaxID=43657 RepID=UPI001B3960AD|nr:aldo/keto reductase [Pseudoalteromonas luteoviolacea]MBQ4809949.1 aldo/keto reductase [Pseudoalteromonas luteoviolacea]
MRKSIPIKKYFPDASNIVYGCMGLGGELGDNNILSSEDTSKAQGAIECALESGINFFDHADIYRRGRAEQVFGQVLHKSPQLRAQMIIQSKCGIRVKHGDNFGCYDFSGDWVTHSVNGILKRLNIEYLDVLMLHRPDPLMEIDELAKAVESLKLSGKINHLAVSNMNLHQISLLQSAVGVPIIANQIEMSLSKLDWLDEGVMVGSQGNHKVDFVSGTLEYCQLNNIQLQAWGSLSKGIFCEHGLYSSNQNVRNTAELVKQLSNKYQVESEAIVLAFLMRHPAGIQPVIGTTNTNRIRNAVSALNIHLDRHDWYNLYVSSRGEALP